MADTPDPLAQAIADLAIINSKLSSGLTQVRENNREMRFDMPSLRIRKAELETLIGQLTMAAPRVRRVLTYQAGKGL